LYRLFPRLVSTAVIDRLLEIRTCHKMERYVEKKEGTSTTPQYRLRQIKKTRRMWNISTIGVA
jgi:hypothetical protein